MNDKQLLSDCLAFMQNDCEVLQGKHKVYLDLDQRLADAIHGEEGQPQSREDVTLRDMMAASLVLPEGISRCTGRSLAGPEPSDGLELIKWWAKAKAKLRYIEVDAMMEARK